jgi:DNA-binding NarL/FixJ family response regulator
MRVLVATDRPQLVDALSLFLSEHGLDVVSVATDTEELVCLAASTHPDVVLVDWQMAGSGSAGAVVELKRTGEPAPVIIMSTATERPLAQMTEADGHVTVGDPPEALLQALREVVPTVE